MAGDSDLSEYRTIWSEKLALRAIYHDLYRRLQKACRPGRTLEVGGGSGNLKSYLGDVVSSDIQSAPWLDVVADAGCLPFTGGSFDNVVFVDVLHHLPNPRRFLAEAARVLKPGGRIVMIEPAITPISSLFYRLFHHEPVVMGIDPLSREALNDPADPWAANQAIPTLLMRDPQRLEAELPFFQLVHHEHLSLFTYPLSGGFKRWSLIPASWVPALLVVERSLMAGLGRFMAFRLLAILERRPEWETS